VAVPAVSVAVPAASCKFAMFSNSNFRTVGLQSPNASGSEVIFSETETAMKLERNLSMARPYLTNEKADLCLMHMARSTELAKQSMLAASAAMAALQQSKTERYNLTKGDHWKKEVVKAAMIPVREFVLWRTAGYNGGLLEREPLEAAWQFCDTISLFDEPGISQLHNARLRNLLEIANVNKQKVLDRADERKLYEESQKQYEDKMVGPDGPEGWLCLPAPQYIKFDCDWLIEGTTTTTTTVTTTTVHPRRER
jgi:hypothetical protein